MRYLLLIAVAALSGCDAQSQANQEMVTDQCLRAQLFKECLAALPAGPQATKYNDWSEVVDSCENASYYQSKRSYKYVKPECK